MGSSSAGPVLVCDGVCDIEELYQYKFRSITRDELLGNQTLSYSSGLPLSKLQRVALA